MTLAQFISTYNGKAVDFDGAYGYQCMDLMHRYIVDVCGLPGNVLAAPTAWQAYQNGDSHFDRVSDPQGGDIAFMPPNIAGVTGSAGHVFIVQSADASNVVGFSQNYPTGSYSGTKNFPRKYVTGLLRLKGGNVSTIATLEIVNSLAHAFLNDNTDRNPGLNQYIGQPVENVIKTFNSASERAEYLKLQQSKGIKLY